jgi:DNA repair protein RecO (recombination protein O)
MSLKKTESIVLHSRRQGETSKILVLFTKNLGKLNVIVKGSRNIKSKHWGSLETLTYQSIILYHKENRNYHYIKQSELIESFPGIHKQLGKLALAAIPCEIITKTVEYEAPNEFLFELLLATLDTLNNQEKGLRNIIRIFVLKYLENYGLKPALDFCSECKETDTKQLRYFAIDKGTLSCVNCGIFTQQTRELSEMALKYIQWFQKASVKKSHHAKVSAKLGEEIDNILYLYMRYQLDMLYELKSVQYLNYLKSSFK